jgi:hypothetical protein
MSLGVVRTSLMMSVCALGLACSADVQGPPKPGGGGPSSGGSNSSGGTGFGAGGTGFGSGGTGFGTGGIGTGGSTFGTGGSGGDPGAGGATGGSGGTGVVLCAPGGVEKALPVIVDDNFSPGGHFAGPMFPAEVDPNPNVLGITRVDCAARPENPAGHVGLCHHFTFQAQMVGEMGAFGGVFWQAPSGPPNWGDFPGIKIAAGATAVKFMAWSDTEGQVIEFSAGKVAGLCSDTVSVAAMVTLTTTPTEYTIDLTSQIYPNGVIGGFVWTAQVATVDEIASVYVDDIRWE